MEFAQFLGLGIGIFFYIILITFILLYIIFTIFRKNYISKKMLNISLYHSIISLLALSYGLILLNGGYDVIIIDLDYSMMLIFLLAMFFIISISVSYHKEFNITYKLLPYAIFILFSVNSIIFYFMCHYYNFICNF